MRCIIIFALLLLTAGCATAPTPVKTGAVDRASHQQRLKQLNDWTLTGKLAYKDANERFSANLHWRHQPTRSAFRLSSFLGITLMTLEQTAQGATLELDGERYFHYSASALLNSMTPWPIPVDSLPQWVKGFSADQRRVQWNSRGTIEQLTSPQGWVVRYDDYQWVGQTLLPHQLTLTREQQWLKIRIDQWQQ